MNRDTAMARWYRRIDPRCFTDQGPSDTDTKIRPSMGPAHGDQTVGRNTLLPAKAVTNDWRPLVNDRRRWTVEAVADHL